MNHILISPKSSIRDSMDLLDKSSEKCLLVVDKKKLIGTLTDGDVRRAILSGNKISGSISNVFNGSPFYIFKSEIENFNIKEIFQKKGISVIPIVNDDLTIVDCLIKNKLKNIGLNEKKLNNVPVVIMAGGKGTRMKPFTTVLPKPLVPIKDRPIIELIIDKFINVGCVNYYLTLNYKKKIMKAYFEELDYEYNLNFIEESEFLGTAGSLKLLVKEIHEPFFVSNCDILVDADYKDLYDFHINGKFDLTLVVASKEYLIPYGSCELNEDGTLSHISEKPKIEILANSGLYIMNPVILKYIPKDCFFHITHLIETIKEKGFRVGVYPISEKAWLDIGEWNEYKSTLEKMSQ